MDAATAEALAWVQASPPAPCRHCGDLLHIVPDTAFDEWAWADEQGHCSAVDADLRCLEPWGGASGRLNWLSRGMTLLEKLRRTRKSEKTWPDAEVASWHQALVMEYVSLKMRAEGVLATTHMHWPAAHDPRPYTFALPEHCGWPVRIAPSGWRCRQCKLATDSIEGLDLRRAAA
jgi:hypothetical protein